MFTFYSVSFILNSKVVYFYHTPAVSCLLVFQLPLGVIEAAEGLGSWACLRWPQAHAHAPLSIHFYCLGPPYSSPFPKQEKFQGRHLRFPLGYESSPNLLPDSMARVLHSPAESGSLPNYL